ncbi:MAG: MobP3 family relaxase, partial [Eubacteriales bacterium]|nr:MobP3 family relaxase [Eubacteriales bacterium]
MARIILKSPYLKPGGAKHLANYARYIATRDGVEKPTDSKKFSTVTVQQKKVIAELLKVYPDSKELYEFEDYKNNPIRENADEFILRAAETHGELLGGREKYVGYIATRPRVEKIADHGLFTDDGVPVILEQAARKVSEHTGNVWTHIISLRREDAARLGYDSVEQWQALLRSQRNMIAMQMKIAPENFRWYAAFHNEGHHPHVHMMAFSVKPDEPYLTEKGIRAIKANLAKEIFRQDLMSIYEKQTESRNSLRQSGAELIAEIVGKINSGGYDNPQVEEMLTRLAEKLSHTSGKKQYGYLKPDVKDMVNAIVDTLADDERIAKLYDLWYEQKFETFRTYTDTMPDKLPLSQNPDFKTIRNAVVAEVMNIVFDRHTFEDENIIDEQTPEPDDNETESADPPPPPDEYGRLLTKQKKNKWDKYHLAKICLDEESGHYDISEAVKWLIESAQDNYTVAQYKLGKIFLRGDGVTKDVPYAFRWLELAEQQNNQYAQCLLGKTYIRGEDVPKDLELGIELLEKSANQGNKYALYALGKLYLDSKDVPKDIEKAVDLLTASADRGFEAAQYLIGKLLLGGDASIRNSQKAVSYLESAASKGNQFAQYLLGKFYLTDDDMAKDIDKAIWYLEASAEQENQWAQYALGKLYLYGRDV